MFVDEMKVLQNEGLKIQDKKYSVLLKNVVCDAQARVFVKQVKSGAGYFGCDKCTQPGVHDGKKMTFPETNASLRSDRSFDEMLDEEHHRGPNPFHGLSLGMVTQFPIDYMHLVCLGVVKRLLTLWKSGPYSTRLSAKDLTSI